MAIGLEGLLMIAAFLLVLWMMTRKPKNFPPGPTKWPIFGYIPALIYRGCAKNFISDIHDKYGKIVGFYILNIPIIIISGSSEIRESLLRDDFSGRPECMNLNIVFGKTQGMVLTTGEQWKSQRRFTLHHLRNLGFGKSSLEGIIHEEIRSFFNGVDEMSGGHDNDFCYPVGFLDILKVANFNLLWNLLTGKKYNYRDQEFKQLMETVTRILNINLQEIYIYNFLPLLSKTLPKRWGFSDFENSFLRLQKCIQEEIDNHKKTINYDQPRDFMDIYLCEIEKQKNDLHSMFHETQLKQLLSEFFMAGIHTTANTISFALLYMILYPEAQRKVQQELDEVVGRERLPSLNDRARLPYVEATIQEVLRLSSMVPTPFPHSPVTTEDHVTFRGYHIPKGAILIFNLYDLHHDPKTWKYPNMFIPERFLQKKGNNLHSVAMYPFSAGKRACPGETLSRNNIFLFFTAILQRYTLKVPDGHPQPSQEPNGDTILFPRPFEVKIQQRR